MGASSGSEMGERTEVGGERADGGDKEEADEGERDGVPFGEVIDGDSSLSCSASCNNLRPYILKSPIEPLSGGSAIIIHMSKIKLQVKPASISVISQSAIRRNERLTT